MRLKKLTLTAVLTAAALVMFVLESQLPPLTAIPGIKPGLSNIFTLFTMETLGPGWAFGLFLTRVTLGCVITGQGSAFLYSFAGGLCAYALMLLLRSRLRGNMLWVRSVLCAMAHNAGQLAAAAARGQVGKVVRVMVLGVPNVGKSTFINKVAHRKTARAEDRPGVTRSKQWVPVDPTLELLDTPGILWPKFDDPEVGKRLAFTGAVKDDVLDIEELACYLMDYLAAHYADTLTERYKIEVEPGDTGYELLEKAGRKRGFLMRGAQVDTERMARILLDEFRAGKLGRFTLETAPTEEVTP